MPTDKKPKKSLSSGKRQLNDSNQSRAEYGARQNKSSSDNMDRVRNLDAALRGRSLSDQMPIMKPISGNSSSFTPTKVTGSNQGTMLPTITVTGKRITPSSSAPVSATSSSSTPVSSAPKNIKPTNTKTSIVDSLKSRGMGSSMDHRKKVAKAFGVDSYKGTAQQNISLLSKINSAESKSVTGMGSLGDNRGSERRAFTKAEVPATSTPEPKKTKRSIKNIFKRK
jgi:hypothetical protein